MKAYIKEYRDYISAFIPDSDIPRRRGVGVLKRDRKREVKKRSLAKYDELFDCNPWNAFVTFTLSPLSYGYNRLDKGINSLAQWFFRAIDRYKQATGHNLAYLLVPELKNIDHLHFHGATLTDIDESETYTDSAGVVHKLWTRSTKRDRHGKYYSYYINQWILRNIGRNEFRLFKEDFGYTEARLYAKKYAIKGKEVNPLAHTYYRSNGLLTCKKWHTESLQVISVIEAYKVRDYKTKYGRVYIVNKEVFYTHIKRYTKNDLILLDNASNPFYKQADIKIPDRGRIDLPAYGRKSADYSVKQSHDKKSKRYLKLQKAKEAIKGTPFCYFPKLDSFHFAWLCMRKSLDTQLTFSPSAVMLALGLHPK